ncbi:hypothetical protein I6A84_36485 [Frankia sp. CNm7]|uniref:Uncharacterized protein n=1 Tax=Frankia nepalensis TaxID=1836974 RepID=A0A937RPV8_9ACTN|nr:hypothetical protein [Frankia nepalensis]MBL7514492.1 hypothetical protein [Frankia nepalensis]MBL7523410.1 hypothetical protein [Frankia nepalensis]MBL7631209.1 hypothetical protein [Frankia nepalensis]
MLPSSADDALDLLSIFGTPGSFGRLARSSTIETVDVPGFGFGPGQSAFMATVASDGTVFIGTTPFSDDQMFPTAASMEAGIFHPDTRRFTQLMIPSSAGHFFVSNPDPTVRGVGGADVADVIVVPDPVMGERVVLVSVMPYHGWDTKVHGEFPSIGQLRRDRAGDWRYEPSLSWTAAQLAALAPPTVAASAFPTIGPTSPLSGRGPASVARLPRSGHLVIAQYFGAGGRGTKSGALLVVDLEGRTRAWWQYPPTSPLGISTVVNPREVVTDPTSEPDDERFVLISDCFSGNKVAEPFPVQEFSYSASSGQITPKSAAVRAAQDKSRMESACFDMAGNLYVARTNAHGLRADAMAVYVKAGRERSLVTAAPATADWPDYFGIECRPDYLLQETGRGGLVRSLTMDPVSGAILLTGLDGTLQVVQPAGAGHEMTFRTSAIDTGLSQLRGPSTRYIGVRRAAVDAQRRILWLPVNQLVLDSISWPYPPFKLDQWLIRVDLDRLLDR